MQNTTLAAYLLTAFISGFGIGAATHASAQTTDAAKPIKTDVKGLNDWTGYIEGDPAADSKLAKIQIGMTPEQVQEIAGKENRFRSYPTAKNLIPFYGSVGRFEAVVGYDGLGRIKYTAKGGFLITSAATPVAVIGIEHDANEGK